MSVCKVIAAEPKHASVQHLIRVLQWPEAGATQGVAWEVGAQNRKAEAMLEVMRSRGRALPKSVVAVYVLENPTWGRGRCPVRRQPGGCCLQARLSAYLRP